MTLVVEGASTSGKTPSNTGELLMAIFRIQMTIHVAGSFQVSSLYDEAACTHGRVRVGGAIQIYHATFAESMAVYLWIAEAAARKKHIMYTRRILYCLFLEAGTESHDYSGLAVTAVLYLYKYVMEQVQLRMSKHRENYATAVVHVLHVSNALVLPRGAARAAIVRVMRSQR